MSWLIIGFSKKSVVFIFIGIGKFWWCESFFSLGGGFPSSFSLHKSRRCCSFIEGGLPRGIRSLRDPWVAQKFSQRYQSYVKI
jgi:hypothetical protein